jgi:hypothetical protein
MGSACDCKIKRKRPLGEHRQTSLDNIKMDLRDMLGGYELDSCDWIVAVSCEHTNVYLNSIKKQQVS